MQLDRKGCVKVNELSYQTGEPDVFAGGDVVTGPAFVIHAIAAGKEGAVSIHRYVHPGQTQNLGRDRRIFTSLDKTKAALAIGGYDTAPRQKPPSPEPTRQEKRWTICAERSPRSR